MSEKTYMVAGYSTLNGERKLRVATDMKRALRLEREGHKDVVLRELPYPMTREQASEFLANGFVSAKVSEITYLDEINSTVPPLGNSLVDKDLAAEEANAFEAALAQVPLRENGRFISKTRREEMARELMAG